jgi:TP901 family phage tail tape measure protein
VSPRSAWSSSRPPTSTSRCPRSRRPPTPAPARSRQLRQAALAAGKDTQYSATQAAQGVTQLSKAGVSTANILGGGLKGALSLAAAGQMDVGAAAETAASAMTQFKLRGDQLPHVADLLAAGAGKAQGSVQDLSMALNQSGLIASQTGLSIEDTTGTLAAFASAGLLGSDAGTSFKTMLQALQNPSASPPI